MALKRMSEYKRDDFIYESPDGVSYDITIVQHHDRKYIEISQCRPDSQNESDEVEKVSWDVDMLLNIADTVREVIYPQPKFNLRNGSSLEVERSGLPKPNIRDERNAADIQSAVDESMAKLDDSAVPVQSLDVQIQQRMARRIDDEHAKISRK